MNIIEKILLLPNDLELPGITDGTFGMSLPTNSLHALANSHTHLLRAARQWVKECRIEFSEEEIAMDDEIQALDRAIEEAEKLCSRSD